MDPYREFQAISPPSVIHVSNSWIFLGLCRVFCLTSCGMFSVTLFDLSVNPAHFPILRFVIEVSYTIEFFLFLSFFPIQEIKRLNL